MSLPLVKNMLLTTFEIEKMQKLPINVEVGTLQVVRIQYCTLEFLFLYTFLFWAFLKRFFFFFATFVVLLFTLVQLLKSNVYTYRKTSPSMISHNIISHNMMFLVVPKNFHNMNSCSTSSLYI